MNTRSIYFRLILWCSGLIALVAVLFAAYIYQGLEARLYAEMEQTLKRRAQQIAQNILPQVYQQSPDNIAAAITNVYSPEANNRFIRISRPNSLVYISGLPKDKEFDPHKIPLPSSTIEPRRIAPISPHANMVIVTTVAEIEGILFTIEMGAPTDDINTALHGLVVTLLFGLPVVILVVSLGAYMLLRRAMGPVEDIMSTAEQITFGNLSNRLPVAHTGDVLEHLSVKLNQMLARLEDAYQQASRFSADASHELRTPLAVTHCELESVAQDQQLPEHLRDRIGSVLEETERLSRIAENLLIISRLDAGEVKIEHELYDLATLAKNTAEQISLLAEQKKIKMNITTAIPTPVYGDPAKIKQIVVNLLDNAIKYTPQGGAILLSVYSVQDKAYLEVRDNGIGIAAAELPHIFERFYRADKARSRQGGTGLGLSIVHSICQAHGATVEIESKENKGTTCRIMLPLAEVKK